MSEQRRDYDKENSCGQTCSCTETEERDCACHDARENENCGCQTMQNEQPKSQLSNRSEKIRRLTREAENMTDEKIKIGKEELQEVYRNATVGMESVEILRPLSADRGFRNILLRQYKAYATVARDIEVYAEDSGIELDSPSIFAKGMMFFTTMVNTMKDKTNSKLAEIMIQGINMGIISITKVINHADDKGRKNEYAEKMLDILQHNLEEMKVFL